MNEKHDEAEKKTRLSASQFVSGILLALTRRNSNFVFSIHDTTLHIAFEKTFKGLREENGDEYNFRFRINTDIHGTSATLDEEFGSFWMTGTAEYYRGSYHYMKMNMPDDDYYEEMMEILGGKELYEELASKFAAHYEDISISMERAALETQLGVIATNE